MTKIDEKIVNMDLDVRNAVKGFKPSAEDGFMYLRTGKDNTCVILDSRSDVMTGAIGQFMEDNPETTGIFYAAVLGHASTRVHHAKQLRNTIEEIIKELQEQEENERRGK